MAFSASLENCFLGLDEQIFDEIFFNSVKPECSGDFCMSYFNIVLPISVIKTFPFFHKNKNQNYHNF